MTRTRMFAIFGLVAFGGSTLIAFLFAGAFATPSPSQKAVAIVHVLPALFATLLIQGPILKQPVMNPLGISGKLGPMWLAAPILAAAAFVLALFACAFLVDGNVYLSNADYFAAKQELVPAESLEAFREALATGDVPGPASLILQGLLAGITFNTLLAFPTELAFRGFLFREIQGGFWRRAFLGAAAEACYFAPVVALGFRYGLSGESAPFALAVLLAWCLCIGPILVYLRARSGSVFPPVLFRGALLGLVSVGSDLTTVAPSVAPVYGWTMAFAFALLLVLLALHDLRQDERFITKSS